MTVEPPISSFGALPRKSPTPDVDGTPVGGKRGTSAWLEFGPFRLSVSQRLLSRDGAQVPIGGRAFDLLVALVERAGEIVGTRQLHNLVWPDVVVEEANLRVCVASLRKALGEQSGAARYVVNVTGRGYAFVAPVTRISTDAELPIPVDDGSSMAANVAEPPQLLVSRNQTIDVLSRLLASGRFARLTGPGVVALPGVAGALPALLHAACGLDAACFALRAQEPLHGNDSPATPASAGREPHSANRDAARGVDLAESRLLIVLDRGQHLDATVAPLFEILSRMPLAYFLTTEREAARGCFAEMPWFGRPRNDQSAETTMVDALDEIGIAALPYPEWRAAFGRQSRDASRRLEELQKENERLRQAISDLTLERLVLRQAAFRGL